MTRVSETLYTDENFHTKHSRVEILRLMESSLRTESNKRLNQTVSQ